MVWGVILEQEMLAALAKIYTFCPCQPCSSVTMEPAWWLEYRKSIWGSRHGHVPGNLELPNLPNRLVLNTISAILSCKHISKLCTHRHLYHNHSQLRLHLLHEPSTLWVVLHLIFVDHTSHSFRKHSVYASKLSSISLSPPPPLSPPSLSLLNFLINFVFLLEEDPQDEGIIL